MTAAYEIPIRLLNQVRTGVILAADVVTKEDGDHNGRPLVELADEWYEKVLVHNRHEDLLKPAEAASLLAVLEVAIDYATENSYDAPEDAGQFGDDVAFALATDEIRFALQEIVNTNRLVAFA